MWGHNLGMRRFINDFRSSGDRHQNPKLILRKSSRSLRWPTVCSITLSNSRFAIGQTSKVGKHIMCDAIGPANFLFFLMYYYWACYTPVGKIQPYCHTPNIKRRLAWNQKKNRCSLEKFYFLKWCLFLRLSSERPLELQAYYLSFPSTNEHSRTDSVAASGQHFFWNKNLIRSY
jgi:hypothetical protein